MNFNAETQRIAAKRLARETGFSAAEIEAMTFDRMLWWLTD
ncbi:hypothetical protein [Pseudomonas sp. A-RE-19]|nr:hypothetical protein [Pseudomonas sp. A-RE-19]